MRNLRDLQEGKNLEGDGGCWVGNQESEWRDEEEEIEGGRKNWRE